MRDGLHLCVGRELSTHILRGYSRLLAGHVLPISFQLCTSTPFLPYTLLPYSFKCVPLDPPRHTRSSFFPSSVYLYTLLDIHILPIFLQTCTSTPFLPYTLFPFSYKRVTPGSSCLTRSPLFSFRCVLLDSSCGRSTDVILSFYYNHSLCIAKQKKLPRISVLTDILDSSFLIYFNSAKISSIFASSDCKPPPLKYQSGPSK